MYNKANPLLWYGRIDASDGELGKRWHEKISFLTSPYQKKSGIALLGFICDEGVRRNQGRVGTAEGPDTLREAMGGFAWHLDTVLYDCGNVVIENGELEKAQEELAEHVTKLLEEKHFPIILGGGHETALGSFMGAYNYLKEEIAIINFDAHFDLRESSTATSGTPFYQISKRCKTFNYLCLGISKAANTKALFKKAEELHVTYIPDTEMTYRHIETLEKSIDLFLQDKKHLYLSIDTDIFPAYQVPAVSAMSGRGVDVHLVYTLLEYIVSHYREKIKLIDITEFNPHYDIHDIGQKTVSRLLFDIIGLIDTEKPLY